MRRHDSSSGDMDDPADNIPAVDSATEETPMEVTATKPKHVKIPPPSLPANGVKSNTVSPQQPVGRQSRPQSANKASGAPVRYFILKSYNRENVERSIDQGVWSTQMHNEQKLREAFERSKDVFLIFSVNMSGHFQGYARMIGNQNQGNSQWEGAQNLGQAFGIEWQRLYDLPFSETESLRNPLNDDKPVKISRDGQELPPDIGEALVQLFEDGAERAGIPRPTRVRVQGPPAQGRSNGQQGMMGRAGGRGNPGRGRGGPEMMNGNAMNMPGPGFFPEMGMPMNGMGPMGPMGPGPMMGMGMDPMNFGRMGGFEGDFGMPNIASMGMGLGHMATPMMMGMGMGDMGAAFPMAMPPPRPPPPCEGLNRPVPTSRPFSNDRTYDDDRVDEFRDPPARSGYSRDRHRAGPSGGDYGRSTRSPPAGHDSRDRRHRGRERSPSPHRRGRTSSRRRSRSRSRSRSKDRHRQRPSFLDMEYSDYTKNFREVKESRSRSRRGREGGSDRGGSSSAAAGSGQGWGMMSPSMMAMNPMMAMLDEDAVVNMYATQYRQLGQPFDSERCRSWFRSMKEKMNMGMGMGSMMGMPGMR